MLREAAHKHTHTYNNLRKEGQERKWDNGRIDVLMYSHNETQQ